MRVLLLLIIIPLTGCVDHQYSTWIRENGELCWNSGGEFERNPYMVENAGIRCVIGNEVIFHKTYKEGPQ